MNNYLIPANSKKSMLILSIFTVSDIILFGTGITITLGMLLIIKSTTLIGMILILLPAITTGIMVMPLPNYHNVRGFLKSFIYYISNRKQYYWKGWCVKDVYGRDFKNRN